MSSSRRGAASLGLFAVGEALFVASRRHHTEEKLEPGRLTTDEYAAYALYGIDERDALDPVTEDGQPVDLLPDVRAGEPDMMKCERNGTEIRRAVSVLFVAPTLPATTTRQSGTKGRRAGRFCESTGHLKNIVVNEGSQIVIDKDVSGGVT